MSSIAIITDTDSSIPLDLAETYKIKQVPITIHFGDEIYQASYDLTDENVFTRIDREQKLPTTSAPSPGQFITAYQEALKAGATQILCFTVSGEISATYKSALTAKEQFENEDIEVIDTRSLCMAQGFMVLAAAKVAAAGGSKEEVLAVAHDIQGRTHLFAALPTLKYIAMSGRVGQLTAGIANILHIQPILSIQDGKLDMLERVRTRSKAWARTAELCVEAAGGKEIEDLALLQVNAGDAAKQFETLLRENLTFPEEIIITELTPGLSVHSGAGLVGTAFVTSR